MDDQPNTQSIIDLSSNENINQSVHNALAIIWQYGQIDGSHHKAWVIDQVVRALLDNDEYAGFVNLYESDDYKWNVGIAP